MKTWFWLYSVFFLFPCGVALSQNAADTAMYLPPVSITSKHLVNTMPGKKTDYIDSLMISMNPGSTLSDLLQMQPGTSVKSYGPGSLSTLSVRGTSSTHTDISWHGISLNQVSSGSFDFSLIPTHLFSSYSLVKNGYTDEIIRPGIGGIISLHPESNLNSENNLNASITKGSNGMVSQFVRVTAGDQRFGTSTAIYFQKNNNDFSYKDFSGVEKRLENASVSNTGFIQDIRLISNKLGSLSSSVWFQDSQREVPGSMVSNVGTAERFDKSIRSVIEWTKVQRHHTFLARQACIIDHFRYTDKNKPSSLIVSTAYLSTLQMTVKYSEKHRFNTGVSNELYRAKSNNYSTIQNRNISSFYVSYNGHAFSEKWNSAALARIESDYQNEPSLLFSTGITGLLIHSLYSRISATRTTHRPSFNDLYWVPGGNPSLNPEKSASIETGLDYYLPLKAKRYNSTISVTLFNSLTKDWILWIPGDGFWSPENVSRVWSRGIESACSMSINYAKQSISLKLGHARIISTNQKSSLENDESINKQLIYVPEHKITAAGSWTIRNWMVSCESQYTGKTFITSDNKQSLPGYFFLNSSINKSFKFKKVQLNIITGISNLFNKSYQVVQYYPMPGREFRIALMCKIN